MPSSRPTSPKLRRASTASEHDLESGGKEDETRVPLLSDGTIATKPYQAHRLKAQKPLALAVLGVLAAPWISFILLYLSEPMLSDETCSIPEWKYPDCSGHLTHKQGEGIPPLMTAEEWREFRRKYQDSVERSSLEDTWENLSKSRESDGAVVDNTGFLLPVEFKYSPGKGRGVYATEPIRQGQQIWDSRFRGVFDTECAAKKYFAQLTTDEQCKAIFWGYNNNFYGHGFQFMMSLDGHAYFNHCSPGSSERNAEHHFEGEFETTMYDLPHFFAINLGKGSVSDLTLQRRNYPGAHGLYAKRDIQPGEEICFNYSEIQVNSVFDYYTKVFVHALKFSQWLTM